MAASGFYHDPLTILDSRDIISKDTTFLQNLSVVPYLLSALHLSAIIDPIKTLHPDFSYSKFKIPFMLDLFNNTPLHYLLLRKEFDFYSFNFMFEYIMEYLEDTEQRTPREIFSVIKSLTIHFSFIITRINPKLRERFLTLCYQLAPSFYKLPRYGDPITRWAFTPYLDLDDQIQTKIYKAGLDVVVFKAAVPYFDYSPTSDDMFMLVKTLITLKSEDVFRSPIISKIIDHLWKETKFTTIILSLIYSVFMLLFSIYVGLGQNIPAFEVVIICSALILLMLEVCQILILRSKYFNERRNVIEMGQSLLMIVYMGLRLDDSRKRKTEEDLSENRLLLEEWISSLLILVGYLLWISYLRFFKSTSKLYTYISRLTN